MSPSLITQDLRAGDPRCYGSKGAKPLLTRLARKLVADPRDTDTYRKFVIQVQDYLRMHDDESLRLALEACPDTASYAMLHGLLARQASRCIDFGFLNGSYVYTLIGVAFTLHAPSAAKAQIQPWQPRDWGPQNNAQNLEALRAILDHAGLTADLDGLTFLPYLVDPVDFMKLGYSYMVDIASYLGSGQMDGLEKVLPHRPWQAAACGPQWRVLVMAARSHDALSKLEHLREDSANLIKQWAEDCFQIPSTLKLVSTAPEQLLPLLTGSGLDLWNCAQLDELRGRKDPPEVKLVSPFFSVEAKATAPGHGELCFTSGRGSCTWALHGSTFWGNAMHGIELILPPAMSRFARVQLGLPPHGRNTAPA